MHPDEPLLKPHETRCENSDTQRSIAGEYLRLRSSLQFRYESEQKPRSTAAKTHQNLSPEP